jgi:hypothetical protein
MLAIVGTIIRNGRKYRKAGLCAIPAHYSAVAN